MTNTSNQLIYSIDELVCAIEQDFDNFANIFDQIVGHIIKNPQHITSFISYTNGQLSNASTRRKGLILLSALIQLCPAETAAEHSIAWINNSLKHCENEKQIDGRAFTIIKPLLELCSKTPELNKIIVSKILEKIIDEIKSIPNDSGNSDIALDCLLTCLRVYPGACGPRKIPVDRYLITYLDSPLLSSNTRKAGKCLHSLQQVGGGGTEGINYFNNWMKQQQRLVATIHSLMDQFFESVTEFGDYEQDIADIIPLPLSELPEGKNFKQIAHRIINTTIFLQEMLLGAYPIKKSVLPSIILNVITRGLAVTSATLGTHVVEDCINLSSYLCLIQRNLLQLLQCLIVCLGSNLLPYGNMICKLITNNLKSIPIEDGFIVKTIRDLRLTAYETLRLWLTTVKSASSIDMFIDTLYPILMSDVAPVKIELNLTVQSGAAKSLNKKARKQLMEQKTNSFAARTQSLNTKYFNFGANYQPEICVSSLQTIQLIINFEGSSIKPIFHKQLQEFIIKTLFNIQHGSISFPYTNEDCQIELYKTLIRLTTNHHYNMPPPLQYAVTLLSKGQTNTNPRIAQVCSIGISTLNSFIHPPFATLHLPLDLDELVAEIGSNKTNKKVNFEINIDESEDEIEEIIDDKQENNKIDTPMHEEESNVKENNLNEVQDNENEVQINKNKVEISENEVQINKNEVQINKNDKEIIDNQNEMEGKDIEIITIIDSSDTTDKSPVKLKESICLSEDEVMEQLTIEEMESVKEVTNKEDDVQDLTLDEEEICNSFVDVISD